MLNEYFENKMAIYNSAQWAGEGFDYRYKIANGNKFGLAGQKVLLLYKFSPNKPLKTGSDNPFGKKILKLYQGARVGEYLIVFEWTE